MEIPIHYVELQHVLMEPHALLAACGQWLVRHDWTTKENIVTCAKCRGQLVRPLPGGGSDRGERVPLAGAAP